MSVLKDVAWAKLCVMNLIDRCPRGLQQQQRRRLRKRDLKHLRSEFALLETSSRLFHLVQFLKTSLGNLFWSSILKECIEVQEKKKGSRCCVFTSLTKGEARRFRKKEMNCTNKRDTRS